MKMKASDLIDKPLYDRNTNELIGEVKSLLVDFSEQRVNFLLIETKRQEDSDGYLVNILRFRDLMSGKEDAQMLADPAQIRRISKEEIFDMLFSDAISIIGLDLYVSNKPIGPLTDFSLDPKMGVIGSVTVQSQETTLSIEIGKELSYREGRVYLDPLTQMT
jgi:sporulation protein YlmC with PRC-barrel domain